MVKRKRILLLKRLKNMAFSERRKAEGGFKNTIENGKIGM